MLENMAGVKKDYLVAGVIGLVTAFFIHIIHMFAGIPLAIAFKVARAEPHPLMIKSYDFSPPPKTFSAIERFARRHQIPILMFTARAQEQDEKMGKECGAYAYLRKPFKAPELVSQIKALIRTVPPTS